LDKKLPFLEQNQHQFPNNRQPQKLTVLFIVPSELPPTMMVNSPETKRKPLELGGLAPNEVYDFHSAFPWNPNRLADG